MLYITLFLKNNTKKNDVLDSFVTFQKKFLQKKKHQKKIFTRKKKEKNVFQKEEKIERFIKREMCYSKMYFCSNVVITKKY